MNNKELDSIKEEIYKCSKCGLCQSVCPVYLAAKNEMYLPRGKYVVLNNFFNSGKKFSKRFLKDLDLCLNCNECMNFCPSNINTEYISSFIKYCYNFKSGFFPFYIVHFLRLFLYSIKKYFSSDKLYILRVKRKKTLDVKGENVVYFEGCFNRYINSSDKNASLNLIEELGYSVSSVNSQCCGLPFLSDGNLDLFERNAEKIIKSIPENTKYIVCSCDSCYQTLKKVLINSSFSAKLVRIEDLLKINNIHLKNIDDAVFYKTLGRKEKYYLPDDTACINKKGKCSLMENFFIFKHKKFVEKFIKELFFSRDEINNKTIITTCQLAKWGLNKGANLINANVNIISYSEYAEMIKNANE